MVSIIIPTYNRKHLLPRAINSVLRQTYQDFEIIIIDDGSTDGTEEMIKNEFDNSKIRYFKFDVNRGVSEARNKGLDEAGGEFIALLDSDDEWFEHTLEKVVDTFVHYLNVGFIIAPYYWGMEEKLTGLDISESGIIPFEDILCGIKTRDIKGGFTAFRKSLVGDMRWNVPYLQFIFFRRLQKKTDTYFLKEPLGRYHFLNDSTSVSFMRKIPNTDLSIRKAREMSAFLDEFGDMILARRPERYSVFAGGATIGLLLDGNKAKALNYAKIAYKYNRGRKYLLLYVLCRLPLSEYFLRMVFYIKKYLIINK